MAKRRGRHWPPPPFVSLLRRNVFRPEYARREVQSLLEEGMPETEIRQTPVMPALADVRALDALAGERDHSRSDLIREAVRRVWLRKGQRP